MRCLVLLLVLLIPSLAVADPAGDKGLANVDGALARTTVYAEYQITSQEAGKPQRTLEARVWRKQAKGLVEFTAPADMKGTKLLALSAAELYTFLPAFGKVRRTSPAQLFGLTTFPDDVLGNGFAQRYTATQKGNQLTATLRSGASGCAKLELVVDQNWVPSTLTCTAANGAWTRLRVNRLKTGEALSDDLFSKRSLEK